MTWPSASNSFSVQGATRIVTTNGLPKDTATGTFPIAPSDPAYQYDRNPNQIIAQSFSYSLPAMPTAAATPTCLGLGPIGVMTNGVMIFDALDDAGRDAGAHEIQDHCNGHPQGAGIYHYHDLSPCLLDQTASSSTLVGYALDGYGIYVERDAQGNLPTNADLDACHGRTSSVTWDGEQIDMYHYDATLEYPYTLGCYHGTSVAAGRARCRIGTQRAPDCPRSPGGVTPRCTRPVTDRLPYDAAVCDMSSLRWRTYVEWPLFPFEGDLRLKTPMFGNADPPRAGEPGGSERVERKGKEPRFVGFDLASVRLQRPSSRTDESADLNVCRREVITGTQALPHKDCSRVASRTLTIARTRVGLPRNCKGDLGDRRRTRGRRSRRRRDVQFRRILTRFSTTSSLGSVIANGPVGVAAHA